MDNFAHEFDSQNGFSILTPFLLSTVFVIVKSAVSLYFLICLSTINSENVCYGACSSILTE